MYGLDTIAAPAEEPVSVDRAKLHLRVDHDVDDELIAAWIVAARELTETHTGRRWVEQGVKFTLADWPCEEGGDQVGLYGLIRLPVQPVASVDTVKCYLPTGTLTTLVVNTDYQTWLDHRPPLIAPAPSKVWPPVQTQRLAAVQIEFTAGYGGAADVPEQAKAAILLCLGYWYENRGDGIDTTVAMGMPETLGIPPGAKRLLDSLMTGGYV